LTCRNARFRKLPPHSKCELSETRLLSSRVSPALNLRDLVLWFLQTPRILSKRRLPLRQQPSLPENLEHNGRPRRLCLWPRNPNWRLLFQEDYSKSLRRNTRSIVRQ